MNQLTYPAPAFGIPAANDTNAPPLAADVLQARFGLRVAARLTESSQDLGPDLTERLRFAREKALARAREVRAIEPSGPQRVVRAGSSLLGRSSGWWFKLAGALPVIALLGGLVLIQRWQDQAQVSVAAEVDAALLSDDLPPKAYSDPGFAEFLKTPEQ
ncbi:MAG TPA: DUF3619 family protein [Burkholderiaceae bacterium]|jgi:hypothetical protein